LAPFAVIFSLNEDQFKHALNYIKISVNSKELSKALRHSGTGVLRVKNQRQKKKDKKYKNNESKRVGAASQRRKRVIASPQPANETIS